MNKTLHALLHSILYNLGWFACVLGAALGYAWFGPIIVVLSLLLLIMWQFHRKQIQGLFLFLIAFSLLGTIVDSSLLHLRIIEFNSNPFAPKLSPPWMIALWSSFALSFYAVFPQWHRQYFLMAILSLCFLPLAYLAGAKLGAAKLLMGWFSVVVIGCAYAVLIPLTLYSIAKLRPSRLSEERNLN